MTPSDPPMQPPRAQVQPGSKRGRGRPPTHGLDPLRRTLRALTTRRLDGRSALAVAVRRWKEDVREMGPTGVRVIDKGQVHQDHAVAVRGVCASLAKRGGGAFLTLKAEYEALVAAGKVRPAPVW